jgi:hypothetical protein
MIYKKNSIFNCYWRFSMNRIILWTLAVIMIFSLSAPSKNVHALEKIDFELVKMGLDNTERVPVFIEFVGNTVVDDLTFGCKKPFDASEIIRPGNIMTNSSLVRLEISQSWNIGNIKKAVQNIHVGMKYKYVFNGFYAELPIDQIVKVADMPGVEYVYYAKPMHTYRTRSRVFLGVEKTWTTVKDPNGYPVNGNGMLVSVTDSGLDYTHVDFGSQKKPVGPKVVISRDLAYGDADCKEEDESSHGTACAGIIAGEGPDNPKTKIKELGMAPKAKLAGYKIGMKKDSPFTLSNEGIMASWDWMIKDNVDVSNNSYGAPGGRTWTEKAQDKAVFAGVSIVASQGNEGSPGQYLPITSGTTASPPNVISAGALDDTDAGRLNFSNSPDDSLNGKNNFCYLGNNGKRFPAGSKQNFQVVDCVWGRPEDFVGLDVKGKVALIQRGPNPAADSAYGPPILFKEKCINAANAGAKAVIMYNYVNSRIMAAYYEAAKNEDPSMFNFIPSFELLDNRTGLALRDALHKDKEWTYGKPASDQNKINVGMEMTTVGNLADFTSSGPNLRGYLKPDVSAPGVEIYTSLASNTPEAGGKNTEYMTNFGGTSAAGPFVAGCATLVRQARPNWDAFEVKRALMNTAEPLKRFSNDYYLPMTSQGQGRVNANLAATSPVLFNPPSALILAESGRYNIADLPNDLFDEALAANIPKKVLNSKIPVKATNYTNKPASINLSYEINSARPDQFDVVLTDTQLTIPPVSKNGSPGVAWFGVTVNLPTEKVKGWLNDIYIWATDKVTNKKWHIGVCVYNADPAVQGLKNTYVGYIDYGENAKFTPNGDGVDDQLVINYEVTNGSILYGAYYNNFLNNMNMWVIDQNSEKWTLIKSEPFLELGPQSFAWDGKDQNGNYILPDGEWSLSVSCSAFLPNMQKRVYEWVPDFDGFDLTNTEFEVQQSTIPPMPTLQAFILPMEPGLGKPFDVGIYIKNATNIKSMQFKVKMPGASDIVQYMGFEKGDFMTQNEALVLFTADFDKEKDTFTVDIQRPLDGVSGNGWILNLKFLAKEANFFDVQFSDLNISIIDDNMKEVKTKAFYKNSEISIYKESFEIADINKDGEVNDDDLKIILNAMDSVDGDERYNWRCDLNYDKLVNMEDMSIFSRYYKQR